MELEGIFKINNSYYLRYLDNKVSKFKKINPVYELYIPDENGEYKLITNQTKLKKKEYTNYKDFKNNLNVYKDYNVDIGKREFESIEIYNNWWNKTSAPDSRVWYLDIEVIDINNKKFPDIQTADTPITHIQILDSYTETIFILATKDVSNNIKEKYKNVKFLIFKDEISMLQGFFKLIEKMNPCIIYAWNGEKFDFPYITNRVKKLGLSIHKLSPLKNSSITEKNIKGKIYFDIYWHGLYLIDMLKLYKNFTFGDQKSYSLEYTSKVVLGEGEGKVNYGEYKSIFEFYEKNYDKFTEYAIKDVILLKQLDDKIGLTNLSLMLFNIMGLPLVTDIFGTVKPWAYYLTHLAYSKNEILPIEPTGKLGKQISGGFVKDPIKGKHSWIISIDYNSLYPSIISSFNISADTYIPYNNLPDDAKQIYDYFRDENEQKLLNDENLVNKIEEITHKHNIIFTGMGFYKRDIRGIIPDIISKLYKERKNEKKKMLLYKALLEKVKD